MFSDIHVVLIKLAEKIRSKGGCKRRNGGYAIPGCGGRSLLYYYKVGCAQTSTVLFFNQPIWYNHTVVFPVCAENA